MCAGHGHILVGDDRIVPTPRWSAAWAAPAGRALNDLREPLSDVRQAAARIGDVTRDLARLAMHRAQAATVELGPILEASIRIAGWAISNRACLVRRFGATPKVRGHEGMLGHLFIYLIESVVGNLPKGAASDHRLWVTTGVDARGCAAAEIGCAGQGVGADLHGGQAITVAICARMVRRLGGELVCDLGERGRVVRVTLPAA